MFRLDDQKTVSFCDGMRRRDFLHAGSAGMLGLGLTDFLALKAQGAVQKDKSDMNVIMLFLVGGPSQLDTFDMKPDAPSEIRGPYKPLKTNVPGIEISEIFPRMARHADKWSLVRTLHHTAAAVHDTGHQMMQTGRLFQGGLNYPHIGSVLGKLRGPKGDVPPHVLLPRPIGNTGGNMPHGQDAGFLGKAYDPFVLNADPSEPNFEVPDMLPPDYISSMRVDRRLKWRDMIDDAVKHFEEVPDAKLLDTTFHQAYTLMSSEKARAAFDLTQESDDTRKRYGQNRFGQSCLMARRLIEAGVRFATVNMFETVFDEITWDIHGSSPFSPIECYSNLVGPMFDNGFTSLVEDLSRTGMLDNTLIIATGEFGRTPKINPAGGRDHWPACWSVVMAGGGIQGGRVVGESDEIGGAPKSRPTSPGEIAATVYHSLGIDLETQLPGPQNRPIRVVDHGVEPIMELFT
ncbi:MAG: DUF1501 domain-containing protein [Acidobacteria bacterium]|nr:DUF1501 domain-containing protein [Acidobacteriota bacterium]